MGQRPLWQNAAALAAAVHRHQLRKDGSTPYVSHPVRVALTVACLFGHDDEATLAAALLHDTIEDGPTDYDDVAEVFGREVADIVAALTKDMRLVEADREPAYDRQLREGPWQARLIKLADVYDNLCDAADGSARAKLIGKARRALALAERDPQADRARHLVASLVDAISEPRRA